MKKVATIGERLKTLLDERSMKQAELGKSIGVDGSSISLYLSNGAYPRPDKIEKICNVFGVAESWLLGFDDVSDCTDPRLSLEDIREINHLSKHDMARIMDMSDDEYDFYKDNVEKIRLSNMLSLSKTLSINIEYIRI